jgi:flagellar hook-length control protein FliK
VAGLAAGEADLQGAAFPKGAKDETPVEITSTLDAAIDPALLLAQSMQAMPRVEGEQLGKPNPALMPSLPALARQLGATQDAPALTTEPTDLPGMDTTKALQFSSKLASARREALEVAAQASAGSQTAETNPLLDQRFQKVLPGERMVEASPALSVALATTAAGGESSGIKQMERQAEKYGVKQVGGGEGAWGQQAQLTGARVDSASATVGTAMPSPETMVAEQVKYWISSGVQNAELTLDGFGKSPVEVSISLNGTEARVEFRTDQAEVRQVLEGSASQLKDLLQSEGMVLSGVSVGSSGQDGRTGSQEQERRPRPHNMKQASVMAPEPLTAARGAVANRLTGRAIDLFV